MQLPHLKWISHSTCLWNDQTFNYCHEVREMVHNFLTFCADVYKCPLWQVNRSVVLDDDTVQCIRGHRFAPTTASVANETKGWELRAAENIACNSVVAEITGEVYQLDQYIENRISEPHPFLFLLDHNHVLDCWKQGNHARSVNHSHSPNSILAVSMIDDFPRLFVLATEDIPKNSEISVEYSNHVFGPPDESKIRCLCGRSTCVGFVPFLDVRMLLASRSQPEAYHTPQAIRIQPEAYQPVTGGSPPDAYQVSSSAEPYQAQAPLEPEVYQVTQAPLVSGLKRKHSDITSSNYGSNEGDQRPLLPEVTDPGQNLEPQNIHPPQAQGVYDRSPKFGRLDAPSEAGMMLMDVSPSDQEHSSTQHPAEIQPVAEDDGTRRSETSLSVSDPNMRRDLSASSQRSEQVGGSSDSPENGSRPLLYIADSLFNHVGSSCFMHTFPGQLSVGRAPPMSDEIYDFNKGRGFSSRHCTHAAIARGIREHMNYRIRVEHENQQSQPTPPPLTVSTPPMSYPASYSGRAPQMQRTVPHVLPPMNAHVSRRSNQTYEHQGSLQPRPAVYDYHERNIDPVYAQGHHPPVSSSDRNIPQAPLEEWRGPDPMAMQRSHYESDYYDAPPVHRYSSRESAPSSIPGQERRPNYGDSHQTGGGGYYEPTIRPPSSIQYRHSQTGSGSARYSRYSDPRYAGNAPPMDSQGQARMISDRDRFANNSYSAGHQQPPTHQQQPQMRRMPTSYPGGSNLANYRPNPMGHGRHYPSQQNPHPQ
eukprot:TRINITY_DN12186_c0_g1_i3.p1 TRINITY_DN12186_c0_g1~~TRINITY_DN12186_c0_g1_i3.p1  ORF type:complete len:759 (+),score=100.22 TRINITY_DN12186_c0_g1_i3:145-2421(+)